MFSNLVRLEKLLGKLAESLESTQNRRFTANQALKADINLAEGSTLNIQMNNMILSADILNECRDIVKELKPFFPVNNRLGLKETVQNYKAMLIQKALSEAGYNRRIAADKLGINYRQLRYGMDTSSNIIEIQKEAEP